jgi:hypothetical protein
MSSSKGADDTGMNLQTVSEQHKDLFLAEPGYYLFNVDLSGADGWTVAAHCSRLGDPTMMDDYKFGLKPAKIIALMYMRGAQINELSRPELKELSKDISEEGEAGWVYFAAKQVQHGTSYGMKAAKVAEVILKQSYKKQNNPITVSVRDTEGLQKLFYLRYPGVKRWQDDIVAKIRRFPVLPCASTHLRNFFGNTFTVPVVNKALAHEPQHNTSYATNTALLRLWNDPENQRDGKHIIIPQHQVHDSLNGQFLYSDLEFAKRKIPEWFNNPLTIANTTLVIPFSGKYGKDWKNAEGYF